MSSNRLSIFCNMLSSLPVLADAVIVEEFTSPKLPRPILKKTVSVGIRKIDSRPTSRYTYYVKTTLGIKLLFPCGMGESEIPQVVSEICRSFTGIIIENYYYVENIAVGESRFDSQAYAVRVDIEMQLRLLQNQTGATGNPSATLTLGSLLFEVLPNTISITRPAPTILESGEKKVSPRRVELLSNVYNNIDSAFFTGLITISQTTSPQTLTLPYGESFEVLFQNLDIKYDASGYGFFYQIALVENI